MGYGHIVVIHEDVIRATDGSIDVDNTALQMALGKALLNLCAYAQRTRKSHDKPFVQSGFSVGNAHYGNGLAHVDRIHSNDSQFYRWHGNCLYSAEYFREKDSHDAARTFAEQAGADNADKPRA